MSREADDLDDDLVAFLNSFRAGIADGNGIREDASVDPHKALIPFLEVGTDKGVR